MSPEKPTDEWNATLRMPVGLERGAFTTTPENQEWHQLSRKWFVGLSEALLG